MSIEPHRGAVTGQPSKVVYVKTPNQLSGTLSGGNPLLSDVVYFIDGDIDLSSTSIEIPAGGLSIQGFTFDTSKLNSSASSYTMFTSPAGGSGNLIINNIDLSVTGASSKIFDITDSNGTHAIEINSLNYTACISLGEITGYRQILESGTGRFGGTPELTLSGNMSGCRISTSIVRGISNITSLFREGTALYFSGRFITGINCDLPASGALIDFQESNFQNDESLELKECFITRSGFLDSSDSTIYPNINHKSVKSHWSGNTGLPNTKKYIKSSCTTEVETVVSAIDTYYPLLGTFTVDVSVHFDMPVNGEFRLLSGNGAYQFSGDLIIVGTANNVIDIRVTKSDDGGSTWPIQISHISRQINSLVGARDVAFFPINFISDVSKNDRLRIEVENKTGTGNVTMELDSFFIITEV